jgi:hypothetical protein
MNYKGENLKNENEISNEVKICPSCDCKIEVDENIDKKVVCFYCFYRSNTGILKFQTFKVMKKSGNTWKTKEDITHLVNEFRREHSKPEIKTKAVYNVLHNYSKYYEDAKKRKKFYLVLKRQKQIKTRGRPRILYKLSTKLLKRVDKYERRWLSGLPINSKVNIGKKFKMTIDYNNRSRKIAMKIKKGDYEPYKYMVRSSL